MFAKAGLLAIMEMKSRVFPPCRSFHSFGNTPGIPRDALPLLIRHVRCPYELRARGGGVGPEGQEVPVFEGKIEERGEHLRGSSMETAGTQSKRSRKAFEDRANAGESAALGW